MGVRLSSMWMLPVVLLGAACADEAAEPPVFQPPGQILFQPVDVVISTPTEGASIRYAYAPDVPTETSGTLYTDPIHVTGVVEINAIAYRQGLDPSPVVSEQYQVYQSAPAAPLIDPGTGTYLPPVNVDMTTTTVGAGIAYTLDGSDPAQGNALIYDGIPLQLTTVGSTTLKAIAFDAGVFSIVSEATYTLAEGTVDAPFFTPGGGQLLSLQPVIIGSGTAGAELRYTTDGSFPTCTTGTVYTTPVTLASGDTLSAVACKAGWLPSAVVSEEYEFGFWMMASFDGGLHQSTDRGETWTLLQQFPHSLGHLATDGYGSWVVTGQFGTVQYSYDRGATWQSSTIDLDMVERLATDTYGKWIATGRDEVPPLMRDSTDQGATWDTPVAPGTGNLYDIATDGVTWVAVSGSGEILRSSDAGNTWTEVYDDSHIYYDVETDDNGTWVASGLVGGGPPYTTDDWIAVSTDNGVTWAQANYTTEERGALSLAADPTGTFLLGGGGKLKRSYNGVDWTSISPVHPDRDVRALSSDGHGRWIASLWEDGVTDGEVWISDNDGTSWVQATGWPAGSNIGHAAFGY